jgi:hypothetical protein
VIGLILVLSPPYLNEGSQLVPLAAIAADAQASDLAQKVIGLVVSGERSIHYEKFSCHC